MPSETETKAIEILKIPGTVHFGAEDPQTQLGPDNVTYTLSKDFKRVNLVARGKSVFTGQARGPSKEEKEGAAGKTGGLL